METVKVSSKGQIVIPKALRVSQHILAGTEMVVTAVGGELRMKPIHSLAKIMLHEVAGVLSKKDRKPMTDAEERKAIAKKLTEQDEVSKQ